MATAFVPRCSGGFPSFNFVHQWRQLPMHCSGVQGALRLANVLYICLANYQSVIRLLPRVPRGCLIPALVLKLKLHSCNSSGPWSAIAALVIILIEKILQLDVKTKTSILCNRETVTGAEICLCNTVELIAVVGK